MKTNANHEHIGKRREATPTLHAREEGPTTSSHKKERIPMRHRNHRVSGRLSAKRKWFSLGKRWRVRRGGKRDHFQVLPRGAHTTSKKKSQTWGEPEGWPTT